MDLKTKCVHGSIDKNNSTMSLSVPIYQSATFSHPSIGESSGYDYARLANPTRDSLENLIAELEFGTDALAFTSGMASISTLMELFSPNDHIIASNDLYGGSIRLFNNISAKNGIKFDFDDFDDLDKVRKLIRKETKAIFVETPTNPMMNVADIEEIAKICKEFDILLIVDNTFLTPILMNPLKLGADIVVHSGTKFLCGHNDVLAGFLVVKDKKLAEELRYIHKTVGNCLSPFDSWLVIRGVKTLAIRLQRMEENAMKIAEFLNSHPKIKKVYYTGLKDHEGYDISVKQARGFGSMLSFRTDTQETAYNILNKTNVVLFAESLGGTETLVTYPMTQTHADVPVAEREAKGIDETLLRLSVGIEDIDDLINDLKTALEG